MKFHYRLMDESLKKWLRKVEKKVDSLIIHTENLEEKTDDLREDVDEIRINGHTEKITKLETRQRIIFWVIAAVITTIFGLTVRLLLIAS